MACIRISYARWTPEDTERGDTDDKGWENEEGIRCEPDAFDLEEGLTPVALAVALLRKAGADETSEPYWSIDTWYCGCEDEDTTGAHVCRSYHLAGFSEADSLAIWNSMLALRHTPRE
jgi:hypothetical protein